MARNSLLYADVPLRNYSLTCYGVKVLKWLKGLGLGLQIGTDQVQIRPGV